MLINSEIFKKRLNISETGKWTVHMYTGVYIYKLYIYIYHMCLKKLSIYHLIYSHNSQHLFPCLPPICNGINFGSHSCPLPSHGLHQQRDEIPLSHCVIHNGTSEHIRKTWKDLAGFRWMRWMLEFLNQSMRFNNKNGVFLIQENWPHTRKWRWEIGVVGQFWDAQKWHLTHPPEAWRERGMLQALIEEAIFFKTMEFHNRLILKVKHLSVITAMSIYI